MIRHPDQPLYLQIADWIRNEISEGRIVAGQRLPPVRELTSIWTCTPGTIQRAYAELADQGLIISRPGQGTHVVGKLSANPGASLRQIFLLHRSEAFLLESLSAGYQVDEIEASLRLAMDRFRIAKQELNPSEEGVLRFAGSHDFLLTWLASHFPEINPRYHLQLEFTGSLGGLISLAEGKADFSGSHLWDPETDTYNTAYVRRLLPGKRTALLCLAYRHQGLILPPGNPAHISGLADLTQPGVLFINRQSGSGTRVWLDATLRQEGIEAASINGYSNQVSTHTAVATAVAEGQANVGFGLEASSLTFGLTFLPLVSERYDLVIPEDNFQNPALQNLASWLNSSSAQEFIATIGGYDPRSSGEIIWVEG